MQETITRLRKEQGRTRLIYGVSLIIVSLVLTYLSTVVLGPIPGVPFGTPDPRPASSATASVPPSL